MWTRKGNSAGHYCFQGRVARAQRAAKFNQLRPIGPEPGIQAKYAGRAASQPAA
jgi:hypothetical protein